MTMLNRASLDRYIRSVGVRQIRLACGLVLFAYLLSHFINHALGNISLDALATGVLVIGLQRHAKHRGEIHFSGH